jgi:hypothetical protein
MRGRGGCEEGGEEQAETNQSHTGGKVFFRDHLPKVASPSPRVNYR